MTIKTRIVGAFAIVLVLLLVLGANALWAITRVDREAAEVTSGMARTNALIELNVQIWTLAAHASVYTVSETTADADQLRANVKALTAMLETFDAKVADAWAGGLPKVREEIGAYLERVAEVSSLVDARQGDAVAAAEAFTELEVLTARLAERAADVPGAATPAVKVLAAVGASGASTFRFRSSRNPADIAAARHWLHLAKGAVALLVAGPMADRPLRTILDALATPLDQYERAVTDMDETTVRFEKANKAWRKTAERLMRIGLAARDGSIGVQGRAVERMLRSISGARVFDFAATILSLVLGTLLAWALVRDVSRPLVLITEAMRRLASGRLDTPIPMADRRDEVGAMAMAVAVFRDGLVRVESLSSENEKESLAKQRRIHHIETLAGTFQSDLSAHALLMAQARKAMTDSAKAVRQIAALTHERSALVATAAADASVNVRRVADRTEEVSTSIKQISQQVSISTSIAQRAVARAQEADVNVRALLSGADKIGDVVGIIQGIAEETNFLALNAAIEAARAGEAGRGFGAVAGEVKQLAVATGDATAEIGRYVAHIQGAMQQAAGALTEIGSAIAGMDENTARIAQAVMEQSTSIDLITSSAARAALGADQVTVNIADVHAASESTDLAARHVLEATVGMAARSEAMGERMMTFSKRMLIA